MKTTKIFLLFIASIIVFLIGYVLTNSTVFKLCLPEQYSCRELLNNIGDPLFYGFFALSIIFLILLFLPRAFNAWKKFAIWFVPLATLLFIFYPDPGSGDYFSPYPEQVFQWVSAFYVGASLGIILTALVGGAQEKKGNKSLRWWWYIAPALLLGYGAIAMLPFVLPLLWF